MIGWAWLTHAHTGIHGRQAATLKAATATILLSLSQIINGALTTAKLPVQTKAPTLPPLSLTLLPPSNWSEVDAESVVTSTHLWMGMGIIAHPHHQYLQGKKMQINKLGGLAILNPQMLSCKYTVNLQSIAPVRPPPLVHNKPCLGSGTPSKQQPCLTSSHASARLYMESRRTVNALYTVLYVLLISVHAQ